MSVSSCMSEISVSINGEDVILEKAIDDVYKKLQQSLNDSQCVLRSLCSLLDQDQDFETSCKYAYEIEDHTNGMNELFKDLKSIVKQVKVKPENDQEKEWLKSFLEQKKLEKEEIKAEQKRIKQEIKAEEKRLKEQQ